MQIEKCQELAKLLKEVVTTQNFPEIINNLAFLTK